LPYGPVVLEYPIVNTYSNNTMSHLDRSFD
jgi:hypothetical protein